MAEIEIGVLSRQCLNRRILDQETLCSEIEKWEKKRNQETVCVNWRFTTEDARIKLKSLVVLKRFLRPSLLCSGLP